MPKCKDKILVFDDGEDEDREDSVAIIDDNDDDDANEDLSLKILEKALSLRDGNKLDSDLSDSGVVSTVLVNGGKKKMKRNKLEADHEIPIVWEDQDEETMVDEVVEGEGEVKKSAEPKTGETCSNLVMKKLLRGARYFDPPDASWASCYRCREQGHITVNCPTSTKRRKPFFICGSLEHKAKLSSKGHNCYICNKGGHRAKHCPDKYKSGSKDALCLRCGGFGHDMILCKYEYSQEDLKDIQCYVCKSFGHLCCVEPNNSPSWSVSCYICGQLGHTGLTCSSHYDETNENDSGSPSCYKCGEAGHFKRDCPNSCGLHFPENTREEETFSLECANSSSIRTSRGRDSRRLCYKCRLKGHFARECPNTSQTCSRHYDENNEDDSGSPSCYKCGEAGHFKRDCPNSCGLHFPENTREEETFSRECANSSSIIRTSRGRDSRRLCYTCRLKGHSARECPNTSQDKLDTYLARNSNLMQCIDQLLSQ